MWGVGRVGGWEVVWWVGGGVLGLKNKKCPFHFLKMLIGIPRVELKSTKIHSAYQHIVSRSKSLKNRSGGYRAFSARMFLTSSSFNIRAFVTIRIPKKLLDLS